MSEEIDVTEDYLDPNEPIKENKDNGTEPREQKEETELTKEDIWNEVLELKKEIADIRKQLNKKNQGEKIQGQDDVVEEIEELDQRLKEVEGDPRNDSYYNEGGLKKGWSQSNLTEANAVKIYSYLREEAFRYGKEGCVKKKLSNLIDQVDIKGDFGSRSSKRVSFYRSIRKLKSLVDDNCLEGFVEHNLDDKKTRDKKIRFRLPREVLNQ